MKRNSNIEVLRFLLMIAICIWHTMVHGFDFKNMSTLNPPHINHIIIMAICVPAVDTFMFISGFYGIRFSFDKLLKLIIQALIISNTIIIIKLPFGGNLSFYDQVLPVSSGLTWWFLSAYVIIMVLSPIINKGIDTVDLSRFRNILIILFFIFSIVKYRIEGGGYNITTLLLIYLLGRYCNKAHIRLSRKHSIIIWTFSIATMIVLMAYQQYFGNIHSIWVLLSYNNPIIILMAVAIFYFVNSFKYKYNKTALFLGNHSLSIYLISEMIGISIYNWWKALYNHNLLYYIFSIIAFAIFCVVIDIPIQIMNKYIRDKVINFLIHTPIQKINKL